MLEHLEGVVNLLRLGILSRGIPGAIRRRVRPRYGDRYSPVVSRHLRIASAMLPLAVAAIWGLVHGGQPEVIRYLLVGVWMLAMGVFCWSIIVLNAEIPEEAPRGRSSRSVRFER